MRQKAPGDSGQSEATTKAVEAAIVADIVAQGPPIVKVRLAVFFTGPFSIEPGEIQRLVVSGRSAGRPHLARTIQAVFRKARDDDPAGPGVPVFYVSSEGGAPVQIPGATRYSITSLAVNPFSGHLLAAEHGGSSVLEFARDGLLAEHPLGNNPTWRRLGMTLAIK